MGRRISLAEPAASLILLKPTFAIPHGGGKRFGPDSLEYRVICRMDRRRRARAHRRKDPEITGLEVYPGRRDAEDRQPSSSWWCAPSIPTAMSTMSRAG